MRPGKEHTSRSASGIARSWCRWLNPLLALAFLLVARSALAQSEAENTAAARALAIEGVKLAEAGDCHGAIDRFTRAEQLYHAPTILLGLGECQCKVGLLVEGTENLNRVAREDLGPKPSAAFVQAQERSRVLLGEYLPKVGRLTLTVETPSESPFEARIDGSPVPPALLGVARPINPGSHEVTVQGNGYVPATERVTVAEGEAVSLVVQLELSAVEPVVAEPPAPTPEPPPPVAEEPNRLPAYVALGVGAVGIGVGTVFGLSAMGTKSDLEGVCRGGSCPLGSGDDIESMQSDATVATIGFGVGLVGIAAGVYLWLTAEPSAPAEASGARPASGFWMRTVVGPGQLALEGGF